MSKRLSDEDVERIATRVAELVAVRTPPSYFYPPPAVGPTVWPWTPNGYDQLRVIC
jgi:hypothetical protein